MADIQPVYDLFCPSPVPLKDLASIELALDLWRREIFQHRVHQTLRKWKNILNTPAQILIPNLPPKLAPVIDKYLDRIVQSVNWWLQIYEEIMDYTVLNHFVDFACDFDGSIHYERSARRIVLCDGLDDNLKFKIACLYCLEEDIVRLWPSVSSGMLLSRIRFDTNRQLYYWIARLRNQLYKIPRTEGTIEATILLNLDSFFTVHNWSATKYFMNRVDFPLTEMVRQNCMRGCNYTAFCRYLLPRFIGNEQLLATFMSGLRAWFVILVNYHMRALPAIWPFIKNRMTPDDFINVIQEMVSGLNSGTVINDLSSLIELWNDVPNDIKQLITERILQRKKFDPTQHYRSDQSEHVYRPRDLCLLLAILSFASAEMRKAFWNLNWRNLIVGVKCDDLQAVMELCLGHQTAVDEFKQNVLSNYVNIRLHCWMLLKKARFSELDEYLRFCCLSEHSVKNFQKNLLTEANFRLEFQLLDNVSSFKKFIYDSFSSDVDSANDYITRLLLSSHTIDTLKRLVDYKGQFQVIMQFIDTLAPTDNLASRLKHDELVPALRAVFDESKDLCFQNCQDDVMEFIAWCLKDDCEIDRFKRAINLDELVQGLMRKESCSDDNEHRGLLPPNCLMIRVMKWCLGTDQAVEEFKRKYAEDEMFAEWFGM